MNLYKVDGREFVAWNRSFWRTYEIEFKREDRELGKCIFSTVFEQRIL